MRIGDWIYLVFSNLNRMRGRVVMTALGVAVGTAAIVVLISLATGLQASTVGNFQSFGSLNQITVFSLARFGGDTEAEGLTPDVVKELSQLEGVVAVTPQEQLSRGAVLRFNRLQGTASIYGIDPAATSYMDFNLAEGSAELNQWAVVIGGYVADSLREPTQSSNRTTGGRSNVGGRSNQRSSGSAAGGIGTLPGGGFAVPGAMPGGQQRSGPNPDAPDLYGRTIQLVMSRNREGEQETRTIPLVVIGVLEPTGGNQDYSIYLSFRSLEDLLTWSQGERPNWQQDGYSEVLVITEQDARVTLDVQTAITDLGYNTRSSTSVVESLNTTFLIIEAALVGIASIALFVATIGIANTMIMSVLERTREIGLMKAVGARNRDVLTIFISESGAIGLFGGLVGLIAGVLIAHGIDLLAASFLSTEGAEASSVVSIPVWLPVFALLFSVVIGLAAGIYPAFRAVLLDPVQALKYE
jgi:ABC-type antimicrobial peptide transport system permease subunit